MEGGAVRRSGGPGLVPGPRTVPSQAPGGPGLVPGHRAHRWVIAAILAVALVAVGGLAPRWSGHSAGPAATAGRAATDPAAVAPPALLTRTLVSHVARPAVPL